ncbi:hypothetical protein WDU94_001267 [Cyamophila willieti]
MPFSVEMYTEMGSHVNNTTIHAVFTIDTAVSIIHSNAIFRKTSPADSKSTSKESAYSATEFSSADSNEKEVEYVQPVKIVPSHEGDDVAAEFREEDAEQSEEAQPSLRHHSGQYRHQTAPVWDPHPEYEFQAFGQLFHFNLELDSGFVHPNIQVTHVFKNTTERNVQPRFKSNGCFYSGNVKGDNVSSISVNLCNGMSMKTVNR